MAASNRSTSKSYFYPADGLPLGERIAEMGRFEYMSLTMKSEVLIYSVRNNGPRDSFPTEQAIRAALNMVCRAPRTVFRDARAGGALLFDLGLRECCVCRYE